MTEEEIIKQIKNDMNVGEFYGITEDAIKGLLNIYNKQKEEIERLKNKLENVAKIRKCFIEIYNDKDNEDDI